MSAGRGWLSRLAHGTREAPVLRAAYESLVALEMAGARAVRTPRRPVEPVAPDDLTLVIKTFERPAVLRRMLASVRRVYAGPIVVADDSRTPFAIEDPLVQVVAMPFDSGVGAGRNALLDAVRTEYLWMADDDMVVLPDLDVTRVLGYLARNPGVDLVGGRVVNLPLWRTADYASAALFAYEGAPKQVEGSVVDGLPVLYKVPNFYIARTASVRAIRYDDRLRRVDHNDFFTSAYGRLVCVLDRAFVCLHAHSYLDAHYQSFRMDTAADLALLAAKWGGRGASRAPTGGEVRPDTLAALHRAALQTVASDLGVEVAPGPLTDLLTQLGWRVLPGGRVEHPLWGAAHLRDAPDAAGVAVARSPSSGGPNGRVRWAERLAWVDEGDQVSVAPLPRGPVSILTSPGDAIWLAVGEEGRSLDDLVAVVLAGFPEAPPEAAAQVRAYVDDLVERGLLTTD